MIEKLERFCLIELVIHINSHTFAIHLSIYVKWKPQSVNKADALFVLHFLSFRETHAKRSYDKEIIYNLKYRIQRFLRRF